MKDTKKKKDQPLRRYLPFLALGPVTNALWAWWALPSIDEQGTFTEMLQWYCVQAAIPVLFAVLLRFRRNYVHWMLMIYGGFIALFAFGILGWALMGEGTPMPIYAVFTLLFVMGFGLLYHSMKDLGFDRDAPVYDIEDK